VNETSRLAERIAASDLSTAPAAAVVVSKQALMDFIGVTIAGVNEPLTQILLEDAAEQGGFEQARVIGTQHRVSVQQAALINGSAGHAHDYDDVQSAMTGHPTVPVAPAVLALAEHHRCTGAQVIKAFLAGVDTECIVARFAGNSHYQRGWHSTGTLGTFGAAAGAAVLLQLDSAQTARALGIAGTQAAGLKAQFGTMCKPLHAGHAAATGTQAARLAAKGFSSREDILEVDQGFIETQSSSADPERFDRAMGQAAFAQDILFKYHAACYLTHSAIEATSLLCQSNLFDPNQIESVTVTVDEGHFKVCNIQSPRTGLEAKFSLRFTTAMTLAGVDTSSIDIFTDELTQHPQLVQLRDKVNVVAHQHQSNNPIVSGSDTLVEITTTDGAHYQQAFNVAVPQRDLELQWQKLEHKFRTLVTPHLGVEQCEEIIALCHNLDRLDDLSPLFDALTPV